MPFSKLKSELQKLGALKWGSMVHGLVRNGMELVCMTSMEYVGSVVAYNWGYCVDIMDI